MKPSESPDFPAPEDLSELEGDPEAIGPLRVRWTIDLRFFNDKDEATGLHAVSMACLDAEGGEEMICPLADAVPGRPCPLKIHEPGDLPDHVDLPSKQWVGFRVKGRLGGGRVHVHTAGPGGGQS